MNPTDAEPSSLMSPLQELTRTLEQHGLDAASAQAIGRQFTALILAQEAPGLKGRRIRKNRCCAT